ncbi:MAG: hypothetical protein HEP71_33050 [Roseivirga sp.]|nr:hypothetical protein [Roseivirga sp.]
MTQNKQTLPHNLLTYKVSTDPDPLYINDPDSKLLITIGKNTEVYLNEIFIEVPADSVSSADTLFLTDPALTYHMTPDTDWQLLEVSTNKSGNVPVIQFSVKPKDSTNQITEDLHLTITGTSNADKGTVEVVIGEHSGKSPDQYEYHETKFPVTKSAAMPFYLNNLISFDPKDPDTPKLSFKTSDEIYLNWDSNGASYELFPKNLVSLENGTTTETHITIPAGVIFKDQPIVIRATDGDKTLYQSLNICIENPILTPTKSLISGIPGENSLQVNNGNAVIAGDSLFVEAPAVVFDTTGFGVVSMNDSNTAKLEVTHGTAITGDLWVKADESGESTTHVDKLFVNKDSQLGDTLIVGETTMNGPVGMSGPITMKTRGSDGDKIEADLDADFKKNLQVSEQLTVNGSIQANGGIVAGNRPVGLIKTPVQFIASNTTISGHFNALTDGYLILPNIFDRGVFSALFSTVLVAYPGLGYNIEYGQSLFPNDNGDWLQTNSLIIPLPQSAQTQLTFSVETFFSVPATSKYYVYWVPMGAGGDGGQSYQWFPNADTESLPEEFLKVRRKHDAQIEKLRQKPEKVRSYIRKLEKAFGQSLDEEMRSELVKDLESLL